MELNQEIQADTELQTTVSQELVLAPEVIESIEILQLPSVDLRQMIHEELETNPTLELQEEENEEDPFEEEEIDREDEDDFDDERLLEMLEERRGRDQTFTGYNQEAADRKMDALYNTPAEDPGLQEEIIQDIHLADVSEDVRNIAEFLAYNLDEDGLLQIELDEALELLNNELRERADTFLHRVRSRLREMHEPFPSLDPFYERIQGEEQEELKRSLLDHLTPEGELRKEREEVLSPHLFTMEEAEEALELIQQLGPDGLGARSKEECFLLQLDDDDENLELKQEMIRECLDEALENDLKKVANTLDISIDRAKAIAEELASLNPTPGDEVAGEAAREVTPDVTVRSVNGSYEVEMNDSFVPRIAVSRKYLDLLRSDNLSKEAKDYVKNKIKSAKNLKSSIQQRRETIKQVSEAIVDRQEEFLEKGINYLKPLKMKEVAEEVGCHVSTVSRAVDGKYIQTPWKVMPLKGFFTQGTSSDDGDGQSRISVMNRIKTIIDEEDKSSPLSDSAIADELEERFDIDISRRTVNKYRKELDIPSSTKRKSY